MINAYYRLAKPGIVYGNTLAAIGGFLLASHGRVDFLQFLTMLIGISTIIASSCVVNNYIDRNIDAKMKRTKHRPLVTGEISPTQAMIYAAALCIIGIISLLLTNILSLWLAMIGFFFYVVLYGYTKRHSPFGTIVGSVSGAVPPVVGYTAASGVFDLGAILIFLAMTAWQMPHFYAIAMFRSQEYKTAGIPVLPLVRGMHRTKISIIGYIVAFLIAADTLTLTGYTGYSFLAVMTGLNVWWLVRGIRGFRSKDDNAWARQMFGASLILLLGFCMMLGLNPWLP